MTIGRDLFVAVQARYGWSAYRTSKALGISQQRGSQLLAGEGSISEETAARAAELLGRPIDLVLVELRADQAKDDQVRAAWRRLAARLATIAGLVVSTYLAGAIGAPAPVSAASRPLPHSGDTGLYIMSNRARRRRDRVPARVPGRSRVVRGASAAWSCRPGRSVRSARRPAAV